MKGYEISFSPTGGTQRAAGILAERLLDAIVPVDLTDGREDFSSISLGKGDVAVIAVPSYGGRAPGTAVQRLSVIKGNGASAILVCVYGNRAYEDTLAELRDTAQSAGFHVICAVAAVAEHSIARQFAAGQPGPGQADGVCRGDSEKTDRWRRVGTSYSRQSPLPGKPCVQDCAGAF